MSTTPATIATQAAAWYSRSRTLLHGGLRRAASTAGIPAEMDG